MDYGIRVANLVLVSGPDVLLLERSKNLDDPGKLGFAGGMVDYTDKSPLAAALREAEEETGTDASNIQLAGSAEYIITNYDRAADILNGHKIHLSASLGRLLVPRPDIRLRESEHINFIWADAARLIDGRLPDDFYSRLLAGIPTILADLYAHRKIANDPTLQRAYLRKIT
jgi:8-oxo-dGTP pyrophosphatase MutT (NUDIX family)